MKLSNFSDALHCIERFIYLNRIDIPNRVSLAEANRHNQNIPDMKYRPLNFKNPLHSKPQTISYGSLTQSNSFESPATILSASTMHHSNNNVMINGKNIQIQHQRILSNNTQIPRLSYQNNQTHILHSN